MPARPGLPASPKPCASSSPRTPTSRGLRCLPGLRGHAHLPELGQLHGQGVAARTTRRPPERVAERIVGLALRPRRSVRVGALHASAVPYALAPDPVGRLAARFGGRFLFRSGPPADATDGGLFETVAGRAEVRGGWGLDERRRARRAVAIGAALVAGTSAVLLSRTGRVERLARALRR